MAGPGEVAPDRNPYRGSMEREVPSRRGMAELAALARIEEVAAHMSGSKLRTGEQASPRQASAEVSVWALGDYHRFARQTVWEVGPVLVEACGIGGGQRVLDVAAGTGNVAIRAAEARALVGASDSTPENIGAGRREARTRGVELEWVEGDAQALPFGDGEFDVVTSSFDVMFAPDQRAAADELLRVCRPGGIIGLVSFTPEGLGGDFFGSLAPYLPPLPPGAPSPLLWGSERHVAMLLGDRVSSLETSRRKYVERAASPEAYCELFNETFGPVVAIRASLAEQPERRAAFERDFLDYATRSRRGTTEGPAEYPYEYLLVIARRRGEELPG